MLVNPGAVFRIWSQCSQSPLRWLTLAGLGVLCLSGLVMTLIQEFPALLRGLAHGRACSLLCVCCLSPTVLHKLGSVDCPVNFSGQSFSNSELIKCGWTDRHVEKLIDSSLQLLLASAPMKMSFSLHRYYNRWHLL